MQSLGIEKLEGAEIGARLQQARLRSIKKTIGRD
jgi:hypothetical protein